MFNLIVVIAILFVAARVLGLVANRFGAPAVVGEVMAGLLLAPLRDWLPLNPDVQVGYRALLIFCGTVYLFVAGFEIDFRHLRHHLRSALAIGSAGLAIPFLAGITLVFFAPPNWVARMSGLQDVPSLKLALTFATVLAISAVPVIAKTLSDLGLLGSRLGALAIASAIFDDMLGWIVLTIVVGSTNIWTSILLGALAIGAIARRATPESVPEPKVFDFVRTVLAPIYFASLALRADFTRHFDLEMTMVVLVVGFLTKWIACGGAARLSGIESREAWSLGAALNSRGAMGIIFATTARDAGVISAELHVSLIALAVVTSLVSGPVIRRLMIPSREVGKGLGKWQPD